MQVRRDHVVGCHAAVIAARTVHQRQLRAERVQDTFILFVGRHHRLEEFPVTSRIPPPSRGYDPWKPAPDGTVLARHPDTGGGLMGVVSAQSQPDDRDSSFRGSPSRPRPGAWSGWVGRLGRSRSPVPDMHACTSRSDETTEAFRLPLTTHKEIHLIAGTVVRVPDGPDHPTHVGWILWG